MDKVLQNKLDKDNPELEKIRDDADAIEDDEKEKLKDKDGKDVKNEVIDKPEVEKLKDDVDADKDYWKKKYSDLEKQFNDLSAELQNSNEALKVYRDKEDKDHMREYLKSYKKCFKDEDYNVMASKIETCSRAEFEKEVDDKVKCFVKGWCEEDDEDDVDCSTIKNSSGFMVNPTPQTTETTKKSSKLTIDAILEKYNK